MASLQMQCLTSTSSSRSRMSAIRASRHGGGDRPSYLSLPHLPLLPADVQALALTDEQQMSISSGRRRTPTRESDPNVIVQEDDRGSAVSKLYVVLEAVADRAEMHAIIGEQRDNWNTLLHSSINSVTLAAALMSGLSAASMGLLSPSSSFVAFKLSSSLLYSAATVMLLVVNKIQPSQLAEEQRNAARLFRQLEKSIETTLSLRRPTDADVDRAVERVMALDKAYPLPLLGAMLDKFPKTVEPTVWWPEARERPQRRRWTPNTTARGHRSEELREEMEGVREALKKKDIAEYVKLGKLVLNINRVLALSGPLLTGLAAAATAAIDPSSEYWPTVAGVACGVLATVVNTVEHGGQIGMVFELFRNVAGYYEQLEQMIEFELEAEEREDGELFEMKVALQLGRNPSELKDLAASSSGSGDDGFAGKLF